VCVRERERERERERGVLNTMTIANLSVLKSGVCVCERAREREREAFYHYERHESLIAQDLCVCVCVCVCEREREGEREAFNQWVCV